MTDTAKEAVLEGVLRAGKHARMLAPEDLHRYVDVDQLQIGADGEIAGLGETIGKLRTERPYLFREQFKAEGIRDQLLAIDREGENERIQRFLEGKPDADQMERVIRTGALPW